MQKRIIIGFLRQKNNSGQESINFKGAVVLIGVFSVVHNTQMVLSVSKIFDRDRFGSVRPEYLGPPLEVVHFDRWNRNLLFGIKAFLFTKSVPLG